jgi:ornithine carbamoyltransferase
MTEIRHFLDLDRFEASQLRHLIERGKAFKRGGAGGGQKPLEGKLLAMIFEKPSTRTRVSFEAGMHQLGGSVIVLTQSDTQLGRGETIADTARVLSRYVDVIMIRTSDPAKLHELAQYASIPVINGLTDHSHPCQVMADVMTFEEHRGSVEGKIFAWSGDGNNVANTWIQAAGQFGFTLRIACPPELAPLPEMVAWAKKKGADLLITSDPDEAVEGAHCVLTDTWVSMGHQARDRHNLLAPYQVNGKLMGRANKQAVFMHCLPAHRGEEVTAEVIDGPQSIVWDEAENRLHVQKGILAWCLS